MPAWPLAQQLAAVCTGDETAAAAAPASVSAVVVVAAAAAAAAGSKDSNEAPAAPEAVYSPPPDWCVPEELALKGTVDLLLVTCQDVSMIRKNGEV